MTIDMYIRRKPEKRSQNLHAAMRIGDGLCTHSGGDPAGGHKDADDDDEEKEEDGGGHRRRAGSRNLAPPPAVRDRSARRRRCHHRCPFPPREAIRSQR
jgi:hypothetical protein